MSHTLLPAERAVSLTLEAEVLTDADTGIPSLVASTDPQLHDLDDVSPARLREMVAAARERLVEFERLADEYEARETLQALLAEHGVQMEEWDTAALDPKLRERFVAFAMVHHEMQRLVVVPQGQDPIARLAAVRDLIADMRGAA
ncbi:hypothetical protein ACFY0F_23640 [Streptomyces sp. NPDC001544]|uniref:hypothetical protein n=1 Tax=Streptomyces sp. NPDC001544 TaxID=3364584 RepID=UPI00367A7135